MSCAGQTLSPVNPRDMNFANAANRFSLRGAPFQFLTKPDQLLLVFTDGVDECHYRSPETSVTGEHIADIVRRVDDEPLRAANDITSLALAGVDGNPGGQDNIAIIAAQS